MSLFPIPNLPFPVDTTRWDDFQARYDALQNGTLEGSDLYDWLRDWSELERVYHEVSSIVYIESTLDTADPEREKAFLNHVENINPKHAVTEQAMKERLLQRAPADDSLGDEMRIPLRNLRNQADLFREDNVPLFTELAKLGNDYDKITGGLKVDWDGEEKNLSQLNSILVDSNRAIRERAWKSIMDLWQSRRSDLNELYTSMLKLRTQVATNYGAPNFRDYAFRSYNRFDYDTDDCLRFHEAIESAVVPAARRIYERKRVQLGLNRLRPWDVDVDSSGKPPLKPYTGQNELIQKSLNIFQQVDPALAAHFATMAEEELLDLDTRKGKALGGYCSELAWRKRPFIFMNGDGIHDDVQTMLHEAGHAFHAFESASLPYIWQWDVPMEFCEVASMGMELLSAPYLTREFGGFYSPADSARAVTEHLNGILTFLPYMAVVDSFQHWVYTHAEAALDPAACDETWAALWKRFIPGVDWSGLEPELVTGWHRKLHIFHIPFYYVEYGMAQVGALQVWRNALSDQAKAVDDYRSALKLGGTRPLPELFAAAGAEFRFDTPMLTELVSLVEETLERLDSVQQ